VAIAIILVIIIGFVIGLAMGERTYRTLAEAERAASS
jgi:hypothetical protein